MRLVLAGTARGTCRLGDLRVVAPGGAPRAGARAGVRVLADGATGVDTGLHRGVVASRGSSTCGSAGLGVLTRGTAITADAVVGIGSGSARTAATRAC